MLHQFVQLVVLFAVEGEAAIILFDELDGLGASCPSGIRSLYKKGRVRRPAPMPLHSRAAPDAFRQGRGFRGVSHGVPQVQGFADAMFLRVFFYDVFLYLHGTSYHGLQ